MRTFAARWDRGLKVSTVIVVLLLAATGIGVPLHAAASSGRGDLELLGLVATLPALATLGLTAALAPRGYAIEGSALRIARPLAPVAIPLREITFVGLLPPEALRGALRLLATSGLFGHFGRFRSGALGDFRLYATRRDGLVRVDTARGRFVLSPEHPERFLEAVAAVAPAARRQDGTPGADAAAVHAARPR